MDFVQIVAPFTRPAAVIAALAGIIALSFAYVAARRAHRRSAARKAAEKRCRQLVSQMRKCPMLRRPQDRRLADTFVIELDAVVKANGFTLDDVGTSRGEIDKILRLVREEVRENPFMNRVRAEQLARAESSGVRAIVLPAVFPEPAPVLSESVFSEADFRQPEGAPADQIEVEIELTPESMEAPAAASVDCNDPIRALQTMADGDLEEFVEDRFQAIVNDD